MAASDVSISGEDAPGSSAWRDARGTPAGASSPRAEQTTHRTIERAIALTGTGLFTGKACGVRILPATPDEAHLGVRFRLLPDPGERGTGAGRHVGEPGCVVPASVEHVVAAPRHTVLRLDPRCPTSATNPEVHTTEHLLAALFAMGVTAAMIEVSGPEVPHLDGSAGVFARAILDAGITPVQAGLRPIVVREPLRVEEGDGVLSAEPPGIDPERTPGPHANDEGESGVYTYVLDYGSGAPPGLHPAAVTFRTGAPASQTDAAHFASTLAPARTFCTQAEAVQLRAMGLFGHITPADAVVFGPAGPLDNTLRFPDEAARHKLIDLLGDLALAGRCRPIVGRITARKTGHTANHALARRIAALD